MQNSSSPVSFKEWYFEQRPHFQAWLAQRCDTSTDYLKMLAYGIRNPGAQFKLLLEVVTGKQFVFEGKHGQQEAENTDA